MDSAERYSHSEPTYLQTGCLYLGVIKPPALYVEDVQRWLFKIIVDSRCLERLLETGELVEGIEFGRPLI